MKWLITGGCGFLGSNLADALLSDGREVIVVDNLSRVGSNDNLQWLRRRHGNQWKFFDEDIRNDTAIAKLISDIRPDVVAHLAGQVAMNISLQDPRRDFSINAYGTFNVLEAIRIFSPHTIFLYSSTNKVYGALNQLRYASMPTRYVLVDYPHGIDETFPIEGASPYGCSKLCAEQYARDYHRIFGLRTVVFRHSAMYGGRQFATYDQGWVGWFCQKAVEMERGNCAPFTICGDGRQVRDVLHVRDVVSLYRQAVERIEVAAGKIYNIGGGMANSMSLIELFVMLEKWCDVSLKYSCLPWRPADQKVFVADIRKAERELEWSPIVSKEKGLYEMLEWTRERAAA